MDDMGKSGNQVRADRSAKESPVRPCRAGSPYPASVGETAGSGDPALQPTASSRLRMTLSTVERVRAPSRSRGSRFRGENRLQAGSYTDHLTAFLSTSEGEVHCIDSAEPVAGGFVQRTDCGFAAE